MKNKKSLLALLLAGALTLGVGFAGCAKNDDEENNDPVIDNPGTGNGENQTPGTGNGENQTPGTKPGETTDPATVEGISLDKTSATLQLGSANTSVKLNATVTPSSIGGVVIWSSGDEKVATVDQSGNVVAVSAGTAVITAACGGKSAFCTVTVNPAASTPVAVESVSLDKTSATLQLGSANTSVKLTATVSPANATETTVSWSSSANAVAIVDQQGNVTAVSAGSAVITATCGGRSATCAITVNAAAPTTVNVESVTLNHSNVTLQLGGSNAAIQLTANVTPANATENTVSWSSSATAVATVDQQGNVTAVSAGSAVITAACGGKSATCTVRVNAAPIVSSQISYSAGNQESASLEWADSAAPEAQVYYKLSSASETAYVLADTELIRQKDSTTARVDVLGLKGGESYDFKIVTSADQTLNADNLTIQEYDRSGYAHFNYTDGVGAYKDDGTLKDNALVIYVTDENKNNVLDYCYSNGHKVDISQYMTSGSTTYTGIGEILNNRRYSGSDRMNVGIAKLCQVYGGVAVRLIGRVEADVLPDKTSTIVGLTDYNSTGNGGSNGDNGRLARMTNAKNVTIEGVGTDCLVYGWGFHFVAGDNLHQYEGAGKSFECRNITFDKVPEDCVGMEGTQGKKVDATGSITGGADDADANLISPVERCWVHNNVFNQGYCANPAQSDKSEGDGACDFKRGQYFTMSYNLFKDCHKTTLLGSSDDSQSFNVSIHHNWMKNVESRQPLARRANVHYYNNYISGASSYVISLRGNCYVFMENNYFYGCNRICKNEDSGGVAKAYNNVYNGFRGNDLDDSTKVDNREATVANNCKFIARDIDYSHFDTDPTQFYYDSVNKKSDCYMTDGVTARKEVMMKAGVLGGGKTEEEMLMNRYTPTTAVSLTNTMTDVELPKREGESNGVWFRDITGDYKAKGHIATFKLASRAEVEIECSGGVLCRADGTVYADKFTTYSGVLEPGIYFISSKEIAFTGDEFDMKNTKEVTLTRLAFKVGETDQERADAIKQLINAIGTVTANSGDAITAARAAYDAATSAVKSLVTNYETLTAAEAAYANLAVSEINGMISSLADVSTATTEADMRTLLASYNDAASLYAVIPADKQSQVVNYDKVTSGIATLTASLKPYDVKNQIAALPAAASVTLDDGTAITAARTAYNALNESEKAIVGDITKLTDAETALKALQNTTKTSTFVGGTPSDSVFTVNNGNAKNSACVVNAYGGSLASGLKMESGTQIKFTISTKMTLKLYFDAPGKVRVGTTNTTNKAGNSSEPQYSSVAVGGDNVVTVTLDAGTYYITKDSGFNLYYAVLTPAS